MGSFWARTSLIWRRTAYIVQNNTTILLPGDTRRPTSRMSVTHFWRQFRSLETRKCFIFFTLLQSNIVFEIINPFAWKVNAISRAKSYLISMPLFLTYIDVRTVKFFPPAEAWLVNSNVPRANCMYGEYRWCQFWPKVMEISILNPKTRICF